MTIDFQKAFESIYWAYLFLLLKQMNFVPKFINCIGLLYRDLFAQVRVGGDVSELFPVRRGTRQGCPVTTFIRHGHRTAGKLDSRVPDDTGF